MRQWHNMLRRVLAEGEYDQDRTGVGTFSVFGHQEVFNLWEGFPLVTTKRVPFRWLAEELFWILRGSTDEWDLREKGVDIWKEWATPEACDKFGRRQGDLGPTYGYLMRRFGTLPYLPTDIRDKLHPLGEGGAHRHDQLRRLMVGLEQNPFSRRHIVTLWDPNVADSVAVPPCPCFFQVKVQADTTMHLHLYQRSADLFLGVPFDIAEYALLLEMLALVTDSIVGKLVVSYGDLHLYSNHLEAARLALSRTYDKPPNLSFKRHPNPNSKLSDLEALLSIGWEDLRLDNYDPDPSIPVDVAV